MSGLSQETVDVYVQLDATLREHAVLAAHLCKSTLMDLPDAAAAAIAVEKNTLKTAAMIEQLFGEEHKDPFLKLWRHHLGLYLAYTEGVKEDDMDAMDQATEDLDQFAEDLAALFSKFELNVSDEELSEGLNEHVMQTKNVIDFAAQEDFEMVFEEEEKAVEHMGHLAKLLAGPILSK